MAVDLGGPAAATPLGKRLRGRAAKVVTLGYHLFTMPVIKRRLRVELDWALAGRHPDDVSFVYPVSAALIAHADDADG